MPNHVHLLIVPSDADGLRQSVANAHRRYAGRLNARNKWTGHIWQGRYGRVVKAQRRGRKPDRWRFGDWRGNQVISSLSDGRAV
jgi:REP element-mobilizing transposase RayT